MCRPPRADASGLVAALTRFSHLTADTIVHGSATSHLAPTDPADRKWAPGTRHMWSLWTWEGGGCREVLASGRARVVQGSPLTALFPPQA